MQHAVIYTRVSTKDQVENLSLETQEEACTHFCKSRNIDVARVFVEEGESAKNADRPELSALLSYCRDNSQTVTHVVVYSVNRLARNTNDHLVIRAKLLAMGIQLCSVTEAFDDTPSGKLMETILAAFGQFDNDVRAERTVAGMKAALERGRWTFVPPLGYEIGGPRGVGPSLVLDLDVAPFIMCAFELVGDARLSRAEALRVLTREGLRSRRGNSIGPQQFDRMLRNPIYHGRIVVPDWDINVPGDFDGIVTEELFFKVQRRIESDDARMKSHRLDRPEFPLRRFVRCDTCGRPLTASWSTGRGGNRYAYYHCPNPACPERIRVRLIDLHTRFEEQLQDLRVEGPMLDLFEKVVARIARERNSSSAKHGAILEQRRDRIVEKKRKLVSSHVYDETIDAETFKKESTRLDRQLENIDQELLLTVPTEEKLAENIRAARPFLADPRGTWEELPPPLRLHFQELVFPTGVTFDGEAIGTAATSPIFRVLQVAAVQPAELASPTGFEPVLPP